MKKCYWRYLLFLVIVGFCFSSDVGTAQESPNKEYIGLEFKGKFRKLPKTSIVRGLHSEKISTAKSKTLDNLLDQLTSSAEFGDDHMDETYPQLNNKTNNEYYEKRTKEELHNVKVEGWIHAVKIEKGNDGDNDFHVVIGTSADIHDAKFLNIEVSALPTGKNRDTLKSVRETFVSFFGDQKITAAFKQVVPPLKVQVMGSLFYDAQHQGDPSGPAWARSKTVWEIHPVYLIRRLQDITVELKRNEED